MDESGRDRSQPRPGAGGVDVPCSASHCNRAHGDSAVYTDAERVSTLTPSRREALLRLALAVRGSGYHFTTVSPATHHRVNQRPANEWARNLRDIFGWNRPFRATLLPLALWELLHRAHAVQPAASAWQSRIRMATLGNQLYMHSAFPTDRPDSVFFGPDTYRFINVLSHWLGQHAMRVQRAVDIGCGAGPGAVTIALACPQAEVIAVDINEQALTLTQLNTELAGASRVVVQHSNLLNGVTGTFDLVVANPPFMVDPSRREYRHGGGSYGIDLSLAVVEAALARLAPGGTLVLYTGTPILASVASSAGGQDPLREAIAPQLGAAGMQWHYGELDPDIFGEELLAEAYQGVERIAAVCLIATRPLDC